MSRILVALGFQRSGTRFTHLRRNEELVLFLRRSAGSDSLRGSEAAPDS
jgi:hypothetical protein